MNFRERFFAALEGKKSDKVPILCFPEAFPRGSFERTLRNRGLGFMEHSNFLTEEMPDVSTTDRKSPRGREIIYHTPLGDISNCYLTDTSRIAAYMHKIYCDSIIKRVEDYEPLIYMIDNCRYDTDMNNFIDRCGDIGEDGFLREGNVGPSLSGLMYLLGLETWSFEQVDNPDEFSRLLDAFGRRTERKMSILAELDSFEIMTIGDISDNLSPEQIMKFEIPFYRKYTELFRAKGKKLGVHAHGSLLKRQTGVMAEMNLDYIESFTPPPYSDLPLELLRKAVGENVCIFINIPESVFYGGYDKTKEYTLELLKSDPSYRKVIGVTEMGMMGVNEENRRIFEAGFTAVFDAVDALPY
jgi:hypothetical protein